MKAVRLIKGMVKPDENCKFAPYLYEMKNDDELIDLYFQTLDWCMDRGFPTNEVLDRICPAKGGFYKEKVNIKNPTKIALFECKGTIEIDDFTVSQIFVRDCEIDLKLSGYAIAIVYAVNSTINEQISDNAKVIMK